MKVVSKTIAMKLKQARDKEKAGDKGVYGKKLHANTSDVLNVQDVGRNQTFNMILGGNDNDQSSRKHAIKMRKEFLQREKMKRKMDKKEKEEKNDNTASVYNEIKEKMGKKFNEGYETSDSEHDENQQLEESDEDIERDEHGKPIKVKLDKEEQYQAELEDASLPRRYIIPQKSNKKFIWDIIIIIFAIVNAVVLPLDIAFTEQINSIQLIMIIDKITMWVFFADVIIGFNTSYINVQSGEEINGYRFIAYNYIWRSTFFLDILSTFPLNEVAENIFGIKNEKVIGTAKLLGFLKIQRLLRIPKLITQFNFTQETKALLKVTQMVFFLIMYIHLIACILWVTFEVNKTWVPAVDFIYAETKLFTEDFSKQYLSMLYHAIMVFGLNEVAPVEPTELVVVIFMMHLSAIVNAYIFGEMAVLVQEMDKKDIDFQESLDNANTAMHSLEIPDKIQDDIREYLMSVNEYKTQQNEMKDFLASISPSLKANVSRYIFFVAINQNTLLYKMMRNDSYIQIIQNSKFKKNEQKYLYEKIVKKKTLSTESVNFFNEIVSKMKIQFEEPEARIVKQNDNIGDNESMFFIERGECVVQINDKDKMRNKSKKVRTLSPGDYFGEIAFIYNSKRSTSVTSTNYTTLGKISKSEIENLFQQFPFFKKELINRTIRYDDDLKIFLESALKTIDYLQEVPDETINKIVFSMTFAKFDKGAKIFSVDETSRMMQIIQNGMVEVYTTMDNGVEFVIERLYRGSVINHRSFISEDKIDVNARCQMPVTLFYILWDKMKKITEECPILQKKIDQIEVALINKDNPLALDYIISRDATVLKNKKKRPRKEQARRDNLTVKLKNAVMYHIVKTRILKRIPNFNEILNMAINKKKREMHAARRKQQEFDLDQLGPEDTYLTDEQFSLIKEQIEKIKLTLEDQETKVQSLKMKLFNLIKKNPQYQSF